MVVTHIRAGVVAVLVVFTLLGGLVSLAAVHPAPKHVVLPAPVVAVAAAVVELTPVSLPTRPGVRQAPVTAKVASPKAAAPVRMSARRSAPTLARRTAAAPTVPFTVQDAQRLGQAAYDSLGRRLPEGWRMRFLVYAATYQGLADSGKQVVTIWVRKTDTVAKLRITEAHELGHVLDYTTLDPPGRQKYLSLRGRSDCRDAWYPANGTTDFASPAGDFAEVYALYRGGAGDFRSTFAPQPTSAQLHEIASLFSQLEAKQDSAT